MRYIFVLLILLMVSCTSYENGDPVDLSGSEVKLTIFHTTDIHSKILPFQYQPTSWDVKMGMKDQDPQGYCVCDDGYYPEAKSCKPISDATTCNSNSDCTGTNKKCDDVYGVCRQCLVDNDCNTTGAVLDVRCVNYQCKQNYSGVKCSSGDCSNGECFDDNGSQYYGGIARLAYVLEIEREKALRSIYIDTGDIYQGAPIFNFFQGEPELRALAMLNVDAQTLGNHEFDEGVPNWIDKVSNWVDYPLVASNYRFSDPSYPYALQTPTVVAPYTIIRRDGLDIGIVGIANTSSMISIDDAGNSMGINPEDVIGSAQYFIDLIKNQVDLVVVASHGGLDVDQVLCKKLSDVDIILGGHHHVFTIPEQEIQSEVTGENCLLLHSGVDLRFLGVLEVIAKDIDPDHPGMEIISHNVKALPFDNRVDYRVRQTQAKLNLPDCPEGEQGLTCVSQGEKKALRQYSMMRDMLDEYERTMREILKVDEIIGFSQDEIERVDQAGASSPLGNLVCDAMAEREYIDVDFAVTNSLGIRAVLPKGNIKISKMFEIFPFSNSITTMMLSGTEIQEMFDFVAAHSADRGCVTQVQVSGGIKLKLDCRERKAKDIQIMGQPLNEYAIYNVATNDYMAAGGSGFSMLARVTTKTDTGISLRDTVIDYIRKKQIVSSSQYRDDTRIQPIK
ncbi:bifunctional metallophosphatase/5'-nucleotidase [bacterium]|nr:bifunctional metallophosphatase/5'-nucleotidase [bacterium]